MLANAAARGGNLLLNVGPMGDGRIDPKDMVILEGVGKWMEVHAESIRGTERTPLPIQSWGHSTRTTVRHGPRSNRVQQGSTRNRIDLHVFDWPRDGRL